MTQPKEQHLASFTNMVLRWMDEFVPKFKEEWSPNCMYDYIDNQPSFSREKKLKYIKGVTKMLTDPSYVDF